MPRSTTPTKQNIDPWSGEPIKTRSAAQIMGPYKNKSVFDIPVSVTQAWVRALTNEGKNPSMPAAASTMLRKLRR